MMIFNIFINFIEAFIFPAFLSNCFDLENKTNFVIISGLIQFLILNLFTYINQSNYILTLVIISINILSLIISLKKITFNNVFVVISYNFIIIISSYIGLFLGLFILDFFSIMYNDELKMMICCILAKIILIVLTSLFLKMQTENDSELDFLDWKPLLVFQGILVVSIALVIYIIVKRKNDFFSLIVLSALLLVSYIYFIFIIIKITKLNKENLLYEKELQQEHFNKEKIVTIKGIKNNIDAIDHRMFYVIFEIDNLIKKNDLKNVQKLIDEYKNIILKQKMIINKKNEIFDCLLSLKINELLINNVDVKTCIFISKKDCFDSLIFINFLSNILDELKTAKYIDIDLNEISDFIKMRLLFEDKNVNLKRLENSLSKSNIIYKLNIVDTNQVKLDITIKQGDLM